jgi:hypothetical protein
MLLIGASYARPINDAQSDQSTRYLSVESPVLSPGKLVVGDGPYSYRFVVRSPRHIDRPHRLASYRIILLDDSQLNDGQEFYNGRTDTLGRTAVIKTRRPLPLKDWDVVPVEGGGKFGQSFALKSNDKNEPIVDYPYLIDVLTGPLYCGRSLPGGVTARIESKQIATLKLYAGSDLTDCLKLQRLVNPIMVKSNYADRIRGLKRLLKNQRLEDNHKLLQLKLDAAILQGGSLAEVRKLSARELAVEQDATDEQRSHTLNGLAYNLLSRTPPRYPDYANALIDESLALNANLYNMDTKGWSLLLLHRYEEALIWFDQSLEKMTDSCTQDQRDAYPELLAHKGIALWSLNRQGEALVLWAQANELTADGSWTVGLPAWPQIGPVIKATAKSLGTTAVQPPACRSINQAQNSR